MADQEKNRNNIIRLALRGKHVGPTICTDADKNFDANGQPGLAHQLGIADVGVLGQALFSPEAVCTTLCPRPGTYSPNAGSRATAVLDGLGKPKLVNMQGHPYRRRALQHSQGSGGGANGASTFDISNSHRHTLIVFQRQRK